jgi:hypothetical protein
VFSIIILFNFLKKVSVDWIEVMSFMCKFPVSYLET